MTDSHDTLVPTITLEPDKPIAIRLKAERIQWVLLDLGNCADDLASGGELELRLRKPGAAESLQPGAERDAA